MPFLLLGPLVLAAACGSDSTAPANVQGSYTAAVTNGQDTCGFPTWTQGTQQSGIPVTITQNGSNVTATVGGATGAALQVLLGQGANQFVGTIGGDSLSLILRGTRSYTSGSCGYTIKATLTGTASGDVLEGAIVYTRDTNSSPDCASLANCSARQDFNATRPPSG